MAFYLLSKLSHFKTAAFSQVPKTQILSHLRSQNDANFMFPRWAADARSFCSRKLDEVDGGCGMESNDLVMKGKVKGKVKGKLKGKSDETAGNAEDARSILSLCKKKRVSDIALFPPEVLDDEGRLRELFEAWMDEFKICYASKKEKAKRFKIFRINVFCIHWLNQEVKCNCRLTWLSADPSSGGGMESIDLAMKRMVKEKVKGKSDETAGNAKDARSVLSLCNVERVSDIILYPPEVLHDEGRLRELFEAWMDEFKIYYATKREKAKRFKIFRFNVFRNSRLNGDFNCKGRLGWVSDHIPGHVTFSSLPRRVFEDVDPADGCKNDD